MMGLLRNGAQPHNGREMNMTTAKQLLARYNRSTGNFADNLREMGADDIAQAFRMPIEDAQNVADRISGNVFNYFRKTLGNAPRDGELVNVMMDTCVGRDCAMVIDAAATLFAMCDKINAVEPGKRAAALEIINDTIETLWHG